MSQRGVLLHGHVQVLRNFVIANIESAEYDRATFHRQQGLFVLPELLPLRGKVIARKVDIFRAVETNSMTVDVSDCLHVGVRCGIAVHFKRHVIGAAYRAAHKGAQAILESLRLFLDLPILLHGRLVRVDEHFSGIAVYDDKIAVIEVVGNAGNTSYCRFVTVSGNDY